MIEITLRVDGLNTPLHVELEPDRAVLFGREPNRDVLPPDLVEAVGGHPVELVSAGLEDLDWVSRNHVLVHCRHDSTWVADLSKSGTWLRLPSVAPPAPPPPITLPGGMHISMQILPDPLSVRRREGPRRVRWTAPEEFGPAVETAVREWLDDLGMQADVRLTRGASTRTLAGTEVVALAEGWHLRIAKRSSLHTDHVSWSQAFGVLHRFIGHENADFMRVRGHDPDFILASPSYRAAHDQVADAAQAEMRVVLLGATGSGKEHLARCYHKHSQRSAGPYVTLNCSTILPELCEARLFGSCKGAFTDARNLPGLVAEADGGTLFLDEIGNMNRDVQAALLRFLDTGGEYRRLGENEIRNANVHIVCATNLPIHRQADRQDRFRDDLWYRLAEQVVEIEPLRKRPEDVIAFLKHHHPRDSQLSAYDLLDAEAREIILKAPLDGNFRELRSFVQRVPPGGRTIDKTVCRKALFGSEMTRSPGGGGMADPTARSPRSSTRSAAVTRLDTARWQKVKEVASNAFEEDYDGPPAGWGQVQAFAEKYIKPVFLAYSAGMETLDAIPDDINLSELARELNIADGKTVMAHLRRYFERFRDRARTG